MRSGARLQAAIEIVGDIDARHRTVAETLKDWGLSHRFAGAKDRAAIGNIVYDALRRALSGAFLMGDATPRAVVLAAFARGWRLGGAQMSEILVGDPHAPEPLSPAEIDRIDRFDRFDAADAPDYVRADVPDWLAPQFADGFADTWVEEGAALALRPPLDLRVNRLRADRQKVLRALARAGAVPTRFSPDGVRIAATERDARHPNVQAEAGFQKGWFEVQDEGSQIAAVLAVSGAGGQVLDLCAGGGGKTLAIAAAMDNRGQVFAFDRDRARLAPIFERLRRAGTRNVQVREAGSDIADLHGRMDAVLVDAPCTGSGVWRRRPEAKWRLSQRALDNRLSEQRELLEGAARFVKPGGRLVYVTCSVLPLENGGQIVAFLQGRDDFLALAVGDAVRAQLPAETAADLLDAGLITPQGLIVSPRRTGTDGFFVSVLRRRAG